MEHSQLIEKSIEYLPVIYLTKSMKKLFSQGRKLVEKDSPTLLINGETGTGKELLAKSIHYYSSPNSPFFTINCVDLPFDHFEERVDKCMSVLSDNISLDGNTHEQHKSTLFLRNIGKLDGNVQVSLFRLLKERLSELSRNANHKQDRVQLIISCNQKSVKEGAYHLARRNAAEAFHPLEIEVKPLRDRVEDIQPLATFFIDKFSKEYGKEIGGIHSLALKALEGYQWQGNVTELRDVVENAVLLSGGPLLVKEDIRFNISKKSIALESFLSREDFFALEEIENIYIQTVLRRVKNNKARAARILGISRNTLLRKLNMINRPLKKPRTSKKAENQPALF